MFRKKTSSSENIVLTTEEIAFELKEQMIDEYKILNDKCDRILEKIRSRKLKIFPKDEVG